MSGGTPDEEVALSSKIRTEAWELLESAIVAHRGEPVGSVAARDDQPETINYHHVFTRDFAVCALAHLLRGESDIVRNFLDLLVDLQNIEKQMDCFEPGEGLMPASFDVLTEDGREVIRPDFGQSAIGRVAPVDSGFWWLLVANAYVRSTGDRSLIETDGFQRAIRYVLDLALTQRYEMSPTLLVPDGSFMIDRRMGVYGHPIDVQSLFHGAVRAAGELLVPDEQGSSFRDAADARARHLAYHVRTYYWLDLRRINEIHRYGLDEFGATAVNKFNIHPDTIPEWLFEWIPREGGYFAGNLGPGRIDFRVFGLGNLLAVVTGLASEEQGQAVLDLWEARWDDLVGEMPLKICFPAVEGRDWRILTGSDPKNTPWSYHNAGSWPVLVWLLAAAALRGGRWALAERAVELAEERLASDGWPEYYDGRRGRFVGRRARHLQTWSAGGYLVARQLLDDPDGLDLLAFDREVGESSCEPDEG